jgi:hypothetical protein
MNRPRLLFAGPSLHGSATALPPNVCLRPPARRGDLIRALRSRPAAIGLIDGLFETGPSVGHKEILHVIAEGVPVFGAASLGALRAAELERFGMIGIGAVFAAYRSGRIVRDDAVMVAHAPAALGHRPLGVALVDAEAAIRAAAIDPADRALLLRIARRMDFRVRTWPAIGAAFAARSGRPCPPTDTTPSLKRADAEALIRLIAGPLPTVRIEPPPRTSHLERLIAIRP